VHTWIPTAGRAPRFGLARDAGVEIACYLIEEIRASGTFDGIHLIPLARYREIAARLEPLL